MGRVNVAVSLETRNRKMPGLNPNKDTGYPDLGSLWCPSVDPGKYLNNITRATNYDMCPGKEHPIVLGGIMDIGESTL
jgi:hypothetical protein